MNETTEIAVLQELQRISKLLVLLITKDQLQTEKITTLSTLGFTSKAIADLIRTTPNTVRATLSSMRKRAKCKSRGSK